MHFDGGAGVGLGDVDVVGEGGVDDDLEALDESRR